MVGNTWSNDNQLASLSQEEAQFISGLNEDSSIDANDWIELGFCPISTDNYTINEKVAEKINYKKGLYQIEFSILLMR